MKIIGLTGSIAMGKSEVAEVFRQENIPVFDSDAAVHSLYESPQGAALVKTIAPTAAKSDRVDRAKLSQIVTKNPEILAQLEPLIHNQIRRQREQFLAHEKAKGTPLLLFDIPLLYETGAEKDVDVVILVSAPEQQQRQRVLARKGMTTEKLEMILTRQMPDSEKRKRADYIIENNGTLEELRDKTRQLISELHH